MAGIVGTNFPYQGRLTDGGAPANGTYDVQLLMFNASVGGSQQGLTQTFNDITVSNGVFTVNPDFGAQYDGEERWIEVRVRPGVSVGAYTTILPRTEATAAPYAQALKLPVTESSSITNGLLTFTNTNSSNTAYVMKLTSTGPSGNTAGIFFQPVMILDTNDGNGLASYTSAAGAYAAYLSSSGNGGSGLVASNTSATSGAGVRADMSNSANTGNTIDAGNSGLGRAGLFTVTNSSNAANAVEIQSNGNSTSQALRCLHTGLGDNALFEITNANNAGEAVEAHTIGTGNAGYFQVNNTSSSTPALYGTSNGSSGVGVYGQATGSFSYGVRGVGLSAGVRGEAGTTNGAGVYGVSTAGGNGGGSGVPAGVRGDASAAGVAGGAFFNNQGTGLYAQSTSGTAGFFSGNVTVTGTLSKGGGSFKIDHPLDPANKYLYHSFVESPDMMNVYTGTAVIGEDGAAVVKLPAYFGALNVDHHYQLTCVGGYAQVYIAEEVKDNQFKIGGGKPGMKVSWQVTGTRNDAFAQYHRIPVETEKAPADRGMYLAPEAFGFDQSKQIGTQTGATGPEKRIN
ncbi:MAG: hypothetical protein KF691_13890 [Phycisphaeraceae bacterium]|nr:hypothetical protein [Phycisphaeraceae bacterium]